MKQRVILWAALVCAVQSTLYSWHGIDKANQNFCQEESPWGHKGPQGWSRYGTPRPGGIIEDKPFIWYGTYRIWWNGDVPYVRANNKWLPWSTVNPNLKPPLQKCCSNNS